MRLLKQFLVVTAVAVAGGQLVSAVQDSAWLSVIFGVLTAVVAIIGYSWVVRRTEHRSPAELGRTDAVAQITRGALIGSAMFASVIAIISLLDGYHVHGLGSASGALSLIGVMAAAAVTEELLFRGVLFRIVEERAGTWVALLVTGVFFGAAHLLNSDATLWGAIAIAIEAGFMLAACYAATRSLWVAIGLHFGWNVAAAGIFGAVVSGNGEPRGLLDATTSGPAWISGGSFGPEGSVFTVVFGIVLTVVFLRLARRRGHFVARRRAARVSPAVTVSP